VSGPAFPHCGDGWWRVVAGGVRPGKRIGHRRLVEEDRAQARLLPFVLLVFRVLMQTENMDVQERVVADFRRSAFWLLRPENE